MRNYSVSSLTTSLAVIALYLTTYSCMFALSQSQRDLQTYFSRNKHLSSDPNDRVIAATDIFLGRPYELDSLGDGITSDFDKRPIFYTGGFDCMTLVSTVLAMVESHNFSSFHHNLNLVRYGDKQPSYFNRHHFISDEWNPSNTRLGFLEDVTLRITSKDGPPLAKVHGDVVDYPQWLKYQKTQLTKNAQLNATQLEIWQNIYATSKQRLSMISYIPFTAFFHADDSPNDFVLAQIPAGSIIEFVTPGWDLTSRIGTKLDVMHLGFVIRKGDTLFLRHAKFGGAVTEVKLTDYLLFMKDRIPQAQGVHIEKIHLK
ncbi:MAG: N-acetylmuramoyl-L-alanine amidase-like domain-containing protein [Pseudomonadota bacterium]|nr:N-acetylmuramoyl-L-alanine amidase-like domain-containing protein [Pseudomonadota bacterium]